MSADTSYLREVLGIDPAEHTGRILELRRARGAGSGDAEPTLRGSLRAAPDPEARDRAALVLEEARRAVLDEDPDVVLERLAALDLEDFPDLGRARTRIVAIARVRDELDEMAADRKLPVTLKKALRDVLTSPGEVASVARDHAVHHHGDGPRARAAKRFSARMRRRYPGVAALEKRWLERLDTAKRDAKDSAAVKGGLGCLGMYLAFSVGTKLVRWLLSMLEGS